MNRTVMKTIWLALLVILSAAVTRAQRESFTFTPHGKLVDGSGSGRNDQTNYEPGIRFPLESAPAYANSQVWGIGGLKGPRGTQCAAGNYSYPWRDNYCETRDWAISLCPNGKGHQGQDIRPATCVKATHWTAAAADGTITSVGTYSVFLLATDGKTRYDYLHMSNVRVKNSEKVKRGDRLGKVSNVFQQGAATTIHLHFNIRKIVPGLGWTYVPPYGALVDSYGRLLAGNP